jgi:hypothetical protein
MKNEKETKITLTSEQYAELRSIISNNKIDELEDLGVGGEDDMKVIGFTLGSVHGSLTAQFNRIEEILEEIEPAGYNPWYTDDESEEEDD